MKRIIFAALLMFAASPNLLAACNANMELAKPTGIYIDHGNGTVTDVQTGLMWQKCTLGKSGASCTGAASTYTWKTALEAAQAANAGAGTFGYTDWRLPDKKELVSLIEPACYSPAINATVFPGTDSNTYRTASPFVQNATDAFAWNVDFGYAGNTGPADKKWAYRVRLVRGGQ